MKPKLICLCGSTKFKDEFEKITMEESLNGNVVMSIGCFEHHDNIRLSKGEKQNLDDLHESKIKMADEIFVVNVKGYIGESTKKGILIAKELGIPIKYLEDPEWYGDGTYNLGEINEKELKEFYDELSETSGDLESEKLEIKDKLIKKLNSIIDERERKSVVVINLLLRRLTELANKEFRHHPSTPTWTLYLHNDEIRRVTDYISEATLLLSKDSLWTRD